MSDDLHPGPGADHGGHCGVVISLVVGGEVRLEQPLTITAWEESRGDTQNNNY